MPPKVDKQPPIDVVDIGSSDDEEAIESASRPPQQREASVATTSAPGNLPVECRSFWKAGAYDVGSVSYRAPLEGELEHARVHPKFLHSNATSHKWAFGAIAELMDNAVDEIEKGATFVKVDKIDIMKDNAPALLFQDDGSGMDPDGLRKCMSLGYSTKKSSTTIGQYGNGFKTSTMRLGADVIVFSRATCGSKRTQSVGLLSYTFLRKTGQDDVIVPMIDFDMSGYCPEPIIYGSQDDWSSNLKTILEWSPFTSKDELMQQFEDVGPHGTKIIIYNLWLNDEGIYELSFDDDDEDIRLRDEANRGQTKLHKKIVELQNHLSYRIRYSLRAYASILYMRKFKNFQILLRGKPVEQFDITNDLKYSKKAIYRPQLAVPTKEVVVETTIGFIKEAPDLAVCGFNVYHKNRLIRPFWKVTGDGSSKGNGVVGILEANFIEPAHDKQDFERSSGFIRLEARLKQMVNDYWRNHCHLVGYQPPGFGAQNAQKGHTTKTQKQVPAFENVDLPVTSLPANVQQHTIKDPVGHDSQVDDPVGHDSQANYPIQESFDNIITEDSSQYITEDGSGPVSINQICEENIELFMRCEDHRMKETRLKKMVEELEKEVEQAKRKCEQLSVHLQTKRKQKLSQQTQRVS